MSAISARPLRPPARGGRAGTSNPAVPAIVGGVGDEARSVLETIAAEQGSPLRLYGRDFRAEVVTEGFDYHGRRTIRAIRPGRAGRFQIDNAATALAALEEGGWLAEIADDRVRSGIAGVRWPGRLEIVCERARVVFDGGHNPAGVEGA